MSTLKQLINKFCPQGVGRKKLWELTLWNKKFNGVEKEKQKKTIPIKCILASEFEKIKQNSGNVKYIATGLSGGDQYTTEELAGNYLSEGEVVCIPGGGTPNVKYHNGKFITSGNCIATSLDKSILNNKFLYYYLDSKIKSIAKFYRGSGIKHPDMSQVLEMQIPLPPLRVQEEIVKILDKFTDLENELENELRMRKMQFNAYRDKLLTFDNGVKFEKLGDLGSFIGGLKGKSKKDFRDGNNKLITYKNVYNNMAIDQNLSDKVKIEKNESQNVLQYGDICFTGSSETLDESGLSSVVTDVPTSGLYLNSFCFLFRFNNVKLMNPNFSKYLFRSNLIRKQICRIAQGVTRFNISKKGMNDITIPVPPLENQKEIVEKLDKFNDMCNEISDGLPLEIELRKKQYEFYRDKLLSFDKKAS